MPITGDTKNQLERLQYTTELDLNMGYYNIELSSESSDKTTIVSEFGKFRYNRFPKGICDCFY